MILLHTRKSETINKESRGPVKRCYEDRHCLRLDDIINVGLGYLLRYLVFAIVHNFSVLSDQQWHVLCMEFMYCILLY